MKDFSSWINIQDIVEHDDGSATITIDTSPEATAFLVGEGFRSVIEKAVDSENTEYSYQSATAEEILNAAKSDEDTEQT